MNENEMIKDLTNILKNQCDDTPDECCVGCDCNECNARTLINAGYRKVGEDEIVVNKDEYVDFLRIRLNELKKHSEFIDGFSQGYEQAKQEIVKKILQELSDEGYKIYEQQGYTFDIGNFYWLIAYAKRKYKINLE